jgi:methionyl-tRNA synthetase
MDAKDLKMALHTVFGYADSLNKYIDTHAPWKKDIAVDSEKKELENILYT